MTKKQEIIDRIHEDWGQQPQSNICIYIFEYLLGLSTNNSLHITYGSLHRVISKATPQAYSDIEMLMAIQYLCGDRVNALDVKFELIEDDNYIEISKHDLNDANRTGQLFHPETGELVKDFPDKIYIYFQPTSLLKNIQN